MNIKTNIRNKIKTVKNIIQSVVENDFFGMASEMGFMLCIGICPFMLFLTALFGWIGKHSFMNAILIFMRNLFLLKEWNCCCNWFLYYIISFNKHYGYCCKRIK